VRAPRQPLEHRLRLGRARRFPERFAVDDDLGVDAEHRQVAAVDRARLARRELEWIVAMLLVTRRDDRERDVQLLEDRAPLWRDGGENDRRRRRDAHARLRRRQISSSGQRFAHSAGTVE
jgi:hypothetical protein